MSPAVKRRGISLGEAIVTIFLIVSAVIVTIALFHSGLRYARMSQTRATAGLFGRKVMQQIRDWARDPSHYDTGWSHYQNKELSDPDFPGFVARISCEPKGRELFNPCSQLESMFGSRAYSSIKPAVPVQVTVAWGLPEQRLNLVSLVGEPERELPDAANVVIRRVSGPLGPVPPAALVGFTATLLDSNGHSIPDISFSWSLLPVTGNATLQVASAPRNGSTMMLKHECDFNPLISPPGPVPGEVQVEAVCRYRGRKITNAIPVSVNLQ